MHIPDGYLGPQTYAALDAAIVPIWAVAARTVKRTLKTKQVPLMALGAAFSFVIMMFNVPVVGGSTGHAVGATLIAIVLGPWAACISVSVALVIQALVFGDGGITAIGANCFNMAVVMPFVGYYTYRLVAGDGPGRRRRVMAAGVGSYLGMVAGAVFAGFEFGIQPLIAHTAAGQPLYAPYPLSVAVPAMALGHALFFGPIEALATMGVVAVLARQESALLAMKPAAKPLRWLWAAFGVLVLLTPIGVLAPGTAWGEWSATELKATIGSVPGGLARLGGLWTAAMPAYAPAFIRNPLLGYLFAAIVGSALVMVVTWGVGALLSLGSDRPASPASPEAQTGTCVRDIAPVVGPRTRRRSLARRTADALGRHVAEVLENEDLAARPGLLQRLDPRVKLLSLLAFAVTASLVRSVPVLAVLFALTLVLAALSHVSAGSLARKVWASAGLLAVLLAAPAATMWITPGTVLVALGPLTLTVQGVLGALTLVFRVVASAGFALLIIWTTRWTDLLAALSAVKVPEIVVATLAMAQKQIVSLLRTAQQIHLARESRTLGAGTSAENRGWVFGRMAFVVSKSVKTADDVYDAMLSRGFSGTVRSARPLRTRPADWLWLSAAALACLAVVVLDRAVLPR